MASAANAYTCDFRHGWETTHEHRVLSQLLLCPREQCRRLALALAGLSSEKSKLGDRTEKNSPFRPIDADERLPGYLRDSHLPIINSRSHTQRLTPLVYCRRRDRANCG